MLKEDDQLIGNIGLDAISIQSRHAELGILIGDKSCWSKGYGTEAMNLMIGHGFDQLNLHKIFLVVVSFNARAIRAYEKVGFRREGVFRDHIYRDGKYHDGEVLPIAEGPLGGKGDFYQCRYGDYLIAMNCTDEKTFEIDIPNDLKDTSAEELMSGSTYKLTQVVVKTRETLILYTAR